MTSTEILLLVFGILVLVIVGITVAYYMRHRELRRRFGPEYDRLAGGKAGSIAVDRHLRDRERRHAQLDLKELDSDTKNWYGEQWQRTQALFVESPETAIGGADELVTRLIAERGYPVGDYDEQLALLSVDHARVLDHYRVAHDIAQQHARGQADTEMLRQALLHYRVLVADILGTDARLKADALPAATHPHPAENASSTVYGTARDADTERLDTAGPREPRAVPMTAGSPGTRYAQPTGPSDLERSEDRADDRSPRDAMADPDRDTMAQRDAMADSDAMGDHDVAAQRDTMTDGDRDTMAERDTYAQRDRDVAAQRGGDAMAERDAMADREATGDHDVAAQRDRHGAAERDAMAARAAAARERNTMGRDFVGDLDAGDREAMADRDREPTAGQEADREANRESDRELDREAMAEADAERDRPERLRARGTAKVPQGKKTVQSGPAPRTGQADETVDDTAITRQRRT